MDNFESVQAYLLSGSPDDEGLTEQEKFVEIINSMKQYNFGLSVISNDWDKFGKFNIFDPLFPPLANSRPVDARANQSSGGLVLPSWKAL